jgi:cobalt-zinc-cadmium efflux system protein
MRLPDIASAILRDSGANEVHDIHVWTLDGEHHALSCHVRIPDMHMDESEKILAVICETLKREFGIDHVTIQFERAGLPQSGYYMPEPFHSTKP